ncbi:hypothetical protein MKX01_033872 [Papaver californicum]|nr:hypothetical protein MKX01_033872 [Papaver californicum]
MASHFWVFILACFWFSSGIARAQSSTVAAPSNPPTTVVQPPITAVEVAPPTTTTTATPISSPTPKSQPLSTPVLPPILPPIQTPLIVSPPAPLTVPNSEDDVAPEPSPDMNGGIMLYQQGGVFGTWARTGLLAVLVLLATIG